MRPILKKYDVMSHNSWITVKGFVNSKGWLEWEGIKGSVDEDTLGISQPGNFREHQSKKTKH